ncbi:uncharacterized protein LOC125051541 [Pieris napi]|uniref:uncharacterized protein LOC125051541 n=1 Tax=Pieris napi TaxID=78633 RepID=UPI001FB8D37D|nr:uncharacterized protein LOC125051541 [Pieris napi]XP_047507884.1 uncharacterized protein LOC125051541 [Pieris napi]XP_047507885.1 uncharacterized protein LOC125051541 [Pieris napi]
MDFNTTVNADYQWPFPKPIVGKPCEPPKPEAAPTTRPAPVAPYCHCDAHSYSPRVEQYKQLLEKEQKLCQDYEQLRKQMVDVTNDILDHPCDDLDTKMTTMYQATYKKRSFPVSDYEKIIAASQSSAPIPIESNRLGVLRCYKDPTHFTDNPPTVRPTINPPGPVHTGVAPISVQSWFTDFPGRSEYMDTYSASAKACWRSMQRFKEPLPSTRRRADDTCV